MQEDDIANTDKAAKIATLQGASNQTIQGVMWRFARRLADRGARIAGLIETFEGESRPGRQYATLQSILTGERYPIFQDLGPMASACRLDGAGIVAACVAICENIERGCDLVVLNKFGQLEAMRSGLVDAFAAAFAREIPILTAVSPAYTAPWRSFSSSMGVILPARDDALEAWWRAVNLSQKRIRADS